MLTTHGVCAVCLRIQFIVENVNDLWRSEIRSGLYSVFCFLIPSRVLPLRRSCCSSCFDDFSLVYETFLAVKRWVLKTVIKTVFFFF